MCSDEGAAALCGRLYVDVIQARGVPPQAQSYLPDGRRTGTSSLSLILRCDGGTQTARTHTAYHTLAPSWGDTFMFAGLGENTDVVRDAVILAVSCQTPVQTAFCTNAQTRA